MAQIWILSDVISSLIDGNKEKETKVSSLKFNWDNVLFEERLCNLLRSNFHFKIYIFTKGHSGKIWIRNGTEWTITQVRIQCRLLIVSSIKWHETKFPSEGGDRKNQVGLLVIGSADCGNYLLPVTCSFT